MLELFWNKYKSHSFFIKIISKSTWPPGVIAMTVLLGLDLTWDYCESI